jgi:regulator of protease activity HflC (stomatin/prohibitin superfamily)
MRIVLIAMILSLSACGTVDTGYRGIWVKFGEVVGEPVSEGLYWYNPFIWDLVEYQVQEEKWSEDTDIFTRDTQQVSVSFSVVYYADPKSVGKLYKEIGRERQLEEKIIKPVVLGSIKDAIGEVIADELVGKREVVTKKALAEVKENLAARHVFVTDLQFTNLNFDDAYERAVEEKVVAIQNAQKAKNVTVQIKEEAEQKITTAKAEAESMRIKSQALATNKGLVEFEAVQKWDGKLPQNVFGNQPMPFIDVQKLGK